MSARARRRIDEIAASAAAAAVAFEARWTRLALRRTRPDLADRMSRQIKIWYDVLPTGDEDRIVKAGEALLRGYNICSAAMEEADYPDDAYQAVQTDAGRVVTFGPKACAEYLAAKYPGSAHYTFEEAAELIDGFGDAAFPLTKHLFPGGEVLPVRRVAKGGL